MLFIFIYKQNKFKLQTKLIEIPKDINRSILSRVMLDLITALVGSDKDPSQGQAVSLFSPVCAYESTGKRCPKCFGINNLEMAKQMTDLQVMIVVDMFVFHLALKIAFASMENER